MNVVAWFLAQPIDAGSSELLQYGGVGLLALFSILAVGVLWRSREQSFREEIERAITRGDRLEAKLFEAQAFIATELTGTLVRVTEAVKESSIELRHRGERQQ